MILHQILVIKLLKWFLAVLLTNLAATNLCLDIASHFCRETSGKTHIFRICDNSFVESSTTHALGYTNTPREYSIISSYEQQIVVLFLRSHLCIEVAVWLMLLLLQEMFYKIASGKFSFSFDPRIAQFKPGIYS